MSKITLAPLTESDREQFIKDNQIQVISMTSYMKACSDSKKG